MTVSACPECQKEVSDQASVCPHCGAPRAGSVAATKGKWLVAGALALGVAASVTVVALRHRSDYTRVEQLRAEQDAQGTHTEHVRQRFFRLHKEHPRDAMYAYLWARCVEDADQQLALAEEGIRDDPAFSWSYNMAARALARKNRVADALVQADKGATLDPGNMQLVTKQRALKLILDQKLLDQPKPAPNGYVAFEGKEALDRAGARYRGLFRTRIRSLDRGDVGAIAKARLADAKGAVGEGLEAFLVCTNPFADACVRVFVPRDARFKSWPRPAGDLGSAKEHQLVTLAGAVVPGARGEPIFLADGFTVADAATEAR
jgi:hypothetical protein